MKPKKRVSAAAILVAGGRGRRFGGMKQFLPLHGKPLFSYALAALQGSASVESIVLVVPHTVRKRRLGAILETTDPCKIVGVCPGGNERVKSVRNGLRCHLRRGRLPEVTVIHDAARPLATPDDLDRTILAAAGKGGAVLAAAVRDTVKRATPVGRIVGTIPRAGLFLAETPQAFRSRLLVEKIMLRKAGAATDESALIERERQVVIVPSKHKNPKVTTPSDLDAISRLMAGGRRSFPTTGLGIDAHRTVPSKPLYLGGIRIPSPLGLLGHSDADVCLHALTDALLGAVGEREDIGMIFPDDRKEFRGARSRVFVLEALKRVKASGHLLGNVDLVVEAEQPKLSPYKGKIVESLARLLSLDPGCIGFKAKTGEGIGEIGRSRLMRATAIVTLWPA